MQATFFYALLSVAVTFTSAAPISESSIITRQTMSGKATFYAPGLGSCGGTNSASDMIMAIADGKAHCGQMATVTRTDTGKSVTVKVVDTCVRCQTDPGVDLSPAAFDLLGDEALGHIPVTWSYGGSSGGSAPKPTTKAAAPKPTTTKAAPKPATTKAASKPATTKAASKPATTKAASKPATTKAASGPCTEGQIICNADGTWSQCGSGIVQLQGKAPVGMKCVNGAFVVA